MLLKDLQLTPHEAVYATRSEYYWGNQYQNLKPWDTDDPAAGLYDKEPRVQIRLTKLAVDTVNKYLFGEQRRPRFKHEPSESDQAAPEEAPVDSRLGELEDESGLVELYSEIGRLGLLHDSVCVGFHKQTINGRAYYDAEVLHGAGTVPTFGRDDKLRAAEEGVPFGDLLQVDERWREERKVDGETRTYIRRRVWTTTHTWEYIPVDVAKIDVKRLDELPWQQYQREVGPGGSVEHGLGFVPAVWIPNGKVAHEYRGVSLVGGPEMNLEDEHNYTLSQTGRGIKYNQDPRTVFTDVDNLTANPIKIGADNSIQVRSSPVGSHQAKMETLELEGTGQEIAMGYANQIRLLFHQLCNVVLHNPDQWAGALSGVALERLLEPMLALVEKLRPFYGRRLAKLLAKMYQADTGQVVRVTANWGPLVTPTVEDRRQAIQTDGDAWERGMISEQTMTESIAPYYGIDDPEAYLREKAGEILATGTVGTQDAQGQEPVDELEGALANL